MKKVLYVLTGLVGLVVGALFIVPPMIANSVVKPRIAAAVEEATGRAVEIGDLGLSIFPSVSVSLKDLRLANAEGMPTPEMVSLGALDLELQLFPLLGKSVLVDKLVVSDLAVFLEVNEEGQPNWVFEGRPAAQDENAGGEGAPLWDVRLGDVRLEGARLSYIDLTSDQTIQATDLNLKIALPSLSGKLTLDGGVTVNDQAIRLALAVDSPGSLMSGEPATIAAVVNSTLMALKSDLKLRQHPLPGLGRRCLARGGLGRRAGSLARPTPACGPA